MKKELQKLENMFQEIRAVDTELTLQSILTLLLVASAEEKFNETGDFDDLMGNTELTNVLNMTGASVSRNVASLSEGQKLTTRPRRKYGGLNLIRIERHPHGARKNVLYLTSIGRYLVEKLTNMLDSEYIPYNLRVRKSPIKDKRSGMNTRTGQRVNKQHKIINKIKELEKQLLEIA
jgi:DNA-binding MarR family transcriptional regulator